MTVIRTTARRISFAVILSVLIHAAIFWLPNIQLSREKLQLPPLTVKLQPLPKTVAQAAVIPEVVGRASKPDDSASEKPLSNTAETMKEMEKSAENHLFPKHLLLSYDVYKGEDIFRTGEIRHQLDIHNDRYTLKAIKQTTGLSSLQDGDQFSQTSQGSVGEQGLRPETFMVEKVANGRKQSLKSVFDWAAQKLRFSKGGDAALPADAQDILSFMYQLSQLSMQSEIIQLFISDGAHLEKYQIEIGRTEDVATPMGILRALHLRKMHPQNEPYFEIWLALEYRLLPVKFQQVDGSGEVNEKFVISDIRAADE